VDERRLLTLQQTADYLQVAPRTLYRWRAERTGPRSVKFGATIRYRRADVEAWLEQHADKLPARRVGRPRQAAAG